MSWQAAIPAMRPAAGRILVADDEPFIRDILARKLRAEGYACDACADGEEASRRLAAQPYDLLLSDIRMPGMDGISLIEKARAIQPDIGVILVTSVVDISVAVEVLKQGACDFVAKPFTLEQVSIAASRALEKRRLTLENRRYRERLEEQIEQRRQQLQEALRLLEGTYHSTLIALGTALDSRDAHTGSHSLRVTLYAGRLARELGVQPAERREIEQGSLLHDIGKIGIPDALLRKPGKLTEAEWAMMRRHPEIGHRILSGSRFLRGASLIVLQHHERFDGSGYPAGLQGGEIVLGARIFAVADTFDCMTSERPFQSPVSFDEAAAAIKRGRGVGFDPMVVDAFAAVDVQEWKEIRLAMSVSRTGEN